MARLKCYEVVGYRKDTKTSKPIQLSVPLRKSDAYEFKNQLKSDGLFKKLKIRKTSCLIYAHVKKW